MTLPNYKIPANLDDSEGVPINEHKGYIQSREFFKQLLNRNFKSFYNQRKNRKQIFNEKIKAIKAEILARNFSHNIGAHVALKATNKNIRKRIKNLYDDNEKLSSEITTYWLDAMSERFDLFEIYRNEYLADIKKPVKNVMFFKDVILPFVENTLILDNITASEGVNYKNKNENNLKIRTFINNEEIRAIYPHATHIEKENESNEISYPDNFPYLMKNKNDKKIDDALNIKEIKGANDIEIALGSKHSFYSILENFIRNCAKHNKKKLSNETNIEIYIHVEAYEDCDYYDLYLSDNHSSVSTCKLAKIFKGLESPLVSEKGKSIRANYGIADMKINSHFLFSSKDISDQNLNEALNIILYNREKGSSELKEKTIVSKCDNENDINTYKSHIEQIIRTSSIQECNENEYAFGYKLKLAKSKKICWIGQECTKKKGISFFKNWEEFEIAINSSSLTTYQFTILEYSVIKEFNEDKGDLLNKIEKKLLKLPFRVLLNFEKNKLRKNSLLEKLVKERRITCCTNIIEVDKNKKEDDILISCWNNWLNRWGIDKDNRLNQVITFENGDTDIVEKWEIEGNYLKEKSYLDVYFGSDPKKDININTATDSVFLNIYGRHSNGINNLKINNENFNNNKLLKNPKYFYSAFNGSSKDFSSFYFPDKEKFKRVIQLLELAEAGLLKILVADERWVELSDDEKLNDSQISFPYNYWNQCACANIFLAHQLIYNQQTITLYKSDNYNHNTVFDIDKHEIKTNDEIINYKFDLIIIHRTFINDLLNKTQETTDSKDINKLLTEIREVIPFIVVVSGGGATHSLSGNYVFAPLSLLNSCIDKAIPKLLLSNSFLNLRHL